MLATLRIKNLALVADLTLELPPGYTALTGETGAGKSIIIGALSLALGQRADRTLIRAGCESCTVEAVFDVARLRSPLPAFLETHGLEPGEAQQLVLKRTFTAAGTNRQFVNGSPTTLATLATLGEWLVDFHGPHEHQSLLQPARQLDILDRFGNLDPLRDAFAQHLRQRRDCETRVAALVVDDQTYARQLDLLRHQVREIEAARLQPGEDETVTQEYHRSHNAARLLELGQSIQAQLTENEPALLTQLGAVGRALHELQRLDPATGDFATLHEQASATLRELQTAVSRYLDHVDLDPDRLRALEERLDLIQGLKRKYGASLEAVLAFGDDARRQLQQLENRTADLEQLQAERGRLDAELQRVGSELTAARRKLIPRLTRSVIRQLADLGFRQAHFDVQLESPSPQGPDPSAGEPAFASPAPHSAGFDRIEFLFAPNPGEPPRPLRAIASSGEIARVMLALKTVLSAQDDIPLLVFDEVDANVGGETAQVVGSKMQQLGAHRQVLCITHLAPVAAAARHHLVVRKDLRDGRTLTEIDPLDPPGRVTELARMLGGQSDAARQHAESLLSRRGED